MGHGTSRSHNIMLVVKQTYAPCGMEEKMKF